MQKYEVEVTGISPLLQNRFNSEQLDTTKKKIITGKQVSVEDKAYTLNGKPYCPQTYFTGCLIEAGKNFKGKGKSNLSKIAGAMFDINPEAIPLTPEKWEIYRISGVNPMTKGRMVIERPMFPIGWKAKFTLSVLTDDLDMGKIKEIFDYAGLYVGIGDWRPAKKGKYGKFILTSFKEVK